MGLINVGEAGGAQNRGYDDAVGKHSLHSSEVLVCCGSNGASVARSFAACSCCPTAVGGRDDQDARFENWGMMRGEDMRGVGKRACLKRTRDGMEYNDWVDVSGVIIWR